MAWALDVGREWLMDLQCLKSMWLSQIKGESHKERLEEFYSPQAEGYDRFRANFLHGRQQLMASCATRLRGSSGLVWVDLGGGTAENVEIMADYMDLSAFEDIHVVDMCSALCNVARGKMAKQGRSNVHIWEGDACSFVPPKTATLITFSYSLSMIPNFMAAVDQALSYLAEDGMLGIADFFTSAKYDLPNRQHSFLQRWFWRAVFDCDGIDLGPERRQYVEHKMTPVFEFNSRGKIPYVPYIRAPYYVWIGRHIDWTKLDGDRFPARASDEFDARRPPTFPPTFLYSLSWEDPREDDKVLRIRPDDNVLTLTSGGCNALDLVLQGAGQVVAVDINPAQSYLLELKRAAVMRLPFEDVWKMFGDGIHPKFKELLRREIAPFLSQGAANFWFRKAHYFSSGLYYHGGMGRLLKAIKMLARFTRQEHWVDCLVNAPTLEMQRDLWFATVGKWLSQANIITRISASLFTNRLVLWFCAGVCKGQLALIRKEDDIYDYVVRCLNSTAEYSHLRDSNYFYRLCLTGQFTQNCCPRFLEKKGFDRLKIQLAKQERLLIRTGSFVEELQKRMYSKVILMDHVDWLDQEDVEILCKALRRHVIPGGRVIWRSASRSPGYAACIERAGFEVTRIQTSEKYMDRVNMYASFYSAVRSYEPSPIKVCNGQRHEGKIDHDYDKHSKSPESPDSVLWMSNEDVVSESRVLVHNI